MMKKMFALALMLCLFALPAWAQDYDVSVDNVVIDACGDACTGHTITGDTTTNTVSVSGTHNITLDNVHIAVDDSVDSHAIQLNSDAVVTLTLEGKNELSGKQVPLHISNNAKLTIMGDGDLQVENTGYHGCIGDSQIAGNETIYIYIKGGNIRAISWSDHATIGSGTYSKGFTHIEISGGTVYASNSGLGPAIGTGDHNSGKCRIDIIGGAVQAVNQSTNTASYFYMPAIGEGHSSESGTTLVKIGDDIQHVLASSLNGVAIKVDNIGSDYGLFFRGTETGEYKKTGSVAQDTKYIEYLGKDPTEHYTGYANDGGDTHSTRGCKDGCIGAKRDEKGQHELHTFSGDVCTECGAQKLTGPAVMQLAKQTYNGKAQEPNPSTITVNGKTLRRYNDYVIDGYSDNINAGTAKVKLKFCGIYAGTAEIPFTIHKATPSSGHFMLTPPDSLVYDGTGKAAAVRVKDSYTGMGEFSVVYRKWLEDADGDWYKEPVDGLPVDVGDYSAYISVTGEGQNFTDKADAIYVLGFTIDKAAPTTDLFTFTPPSNLNYNAEPKAATVAPNSGVNGMGVITLIYCDEQGDPINESPLNAGMYTVKINVTEGENYTAVEGVTGRWWKFTINPIDPTFALPENLTATYGDTLSDVALSPEANGTWSWETGDALVGVVGQQTHKATFTPNDSRNYNTITGVDVFVTVQKAAPAVTAPTANTLTYTGSAQTLITAGSTADGEMRYSLDGNNWSDALPTGTEAGEYTVYYKVIGDSNHLDSEAASVTVTIAQSATSMTAGANKTEYTYGEDVTITVIPAATGAAPLSLRRFTAPAKGQVALYNGSEQITEPKAAGHGETVTFTLDTVADGLTPGSHTLTARYTASGNMDAQEASVSFLVAFAEDAPENDADVSGDKNEAGWNNDDPTLTAPEGSKISFDFGPEAEWSDSLTLPTEDGEHPYTYYVKDESGLISEKTVTVMMDKSAPVVGEIDIQVGTNGAEITAPATDEHSGILDCRITVNSGKGELEISGKGDGRYTITGMIPGEMYDFTLTVRDRVGHTTAVSFTVTAAQLPQTGDSSSLILWLAMLSVASTAMLCLRRRVN